MPGITNAPTERAALPVVLAAVPMVPLAQVATTVLDPDCAPRPLALLYVQIVALGGAATLIARLASAQARPTKDRSAARTRVAHAAIADEPPAADRAADAPDACPLHERLPAHLRQPITCLQLEDHYVRVHVPSASTLLLMRLTDAIGEVGATSGLRVHRSWWVARDAIAAVQPRGRSLQLVLTNGLTVPVSQPYVAELRRSVVG